jgi:hypothetical protein
MIRKTVLTTAIIGAGLASTAGAAFAGDDPGDGGQSSDNSSWSHSSHSSHHDSWHPAKDASGCSNSFQGETGNSQNIGGLLNDSQGAIGLNVCDLVSHNNVLDNNHINL